MVLTGEIPCAAGEVYGEQVSEGPSGKPVIRRPLKEDMQEQGTEPFPT